MSDQELDAFYQEEYRRLYRQPGTWRSRSGSTGGASICPAVIRAGDIDSLAHHLDIAVRQGCSYRSSSGIPCQSTGIEPGTEYRRYAQESGLAVYARWLS